MASTQSLLNTGPQEKSYFVVKCRNIEALKKCYKTGKWACRDRVSPPHPRCILAGSLEKGPVVLIFSVNNCHGWHGYCDMIDFPVSGDTKSDSTSKIVDSVAEDVKISHSSVKMIDSSTVDCNISYSCVAMNDGFAYGGSKSDCSAEMTDSSAAGGNKSDSCTEMIDSSVGSGNKLDSCAEMIDSSIAGGNKSDSCTEMIDSSVAGDDKSDSCAEMIDSSIAGGNKSEIGIAMIDSFAYGDNSPDSGSESKNSVITKNINEDHLKTNASNIPEKRLEETEWHYFNVKWKTIYLKEFGEQCLPSSATESFSVSDSLKVNKARNWQELPEEIGKRMCEMIDNHYSELKQKSQAKLDAQTSKRPTAFLTSDINESNQSDWQKIVDKIEVELGRVHLACPFGSQRYNLHRPDSDVDVFIIYQASTKDILGLNPPKQTIKNSDREGCDYTILELHRYCDLLAGGDPRCVETLFLHESTIVKCSQEWRKLQEKSHTFLTRQCLDKYLRDGLGSNGVKQLLRWKQEHSERKELPAKIYKLVYVIIRLLQNARDITQGGPLKVYRGVDTEEHEILMSVRHGQKAFDDMWLIVKSLLDEVEQQKDNVITDTTEAKNIAENWLLQQRYYDFSLHSCLLSDDPVK
ncbi:uncharacterized protein LOC121382323 [Gigantopelta aegis]|uniref:uncharacterized protein LOC121382323 n=1 Tax=Gigantopelta aegis TaxID=1735272 RepID=UPI001B88D369|nr:uncharacterized protein LOC121382323 [Gigantopelta aegis]